MQVSCSSEDCDRPAYCRGLCSACYQRAWYHGELPDPPARTCPACGEGFVPKKRNAICCSKRCNDNARCARRREATGRRVDQCDYCGGSMEGRRPQARFCSDECAQDSRNERLREQRKREKVIRGKSCRGCEGPIPVQRRGNALYCSEECKIRSRRHEAYGLTKADLDVLLVQHEVCAICKTDEWGKKGPQVDHCHSTGRVRGVLCTSCNNGLGRFHDDVERLRAAIDYLTG